MYKTWAHALHVKIKILQILKVITGEYLQVWSKGGFTICLSLDCHNKIS